METYVIRRAGFKTVGASGKDIFRGDVSCQTHFFRGGVAKLHLVVGPFGGGGGGKSALP